MWLAEISYKWSVIYKDVDEEFVIYVDNEFDNEFATIRLANVETVIRNQMDLHELLINPKKVKNKNLLDFEMNHLICSYKTF